MTDAGKRQQPARVPLSLCSARVFCFPNPDTALSRCPRHANAYFFIGTLFIIHELAQKTTISMKFLYDSYNPKGRLHLSNPPCVTSGSLYKLDLNLHSSLPFRSLLSPSIYMPVVSHLRVYCEYKKDASRPNEGAGSIRIGVTSGLPTVITKACVCEAI